MGQGVVSLILTVAVAVPHAQGSPTIEFFGGASSLNALTPRVLATGPDASYFNPSLLPRLKPQLSLGLFLFSEQSNIRLLERPDGVDISNAIYEASFTDSSPSRRPLPTAQLAPRPALNDVSTVEPFLDVGLISRLIADKLVFGFLARLPVAQFQSMDSFFADEREQYFSNTLHPALRGDRLRMVSFALALGGKVTDWLSLGAGFSLSLNTVANSKVFLPNATNQEEVVVNSSLEVNADMSPHAALAFTPAEDWAVTFGVKGSSGQDVRTNNELIFWSTGPTKNQEFSLSTGYLPTRVFVGAELLAWTCGDEELRVGTEAVWEHWASYRNRHGEAPRTVWSDTVSLGLGSRYRSGSMQFSIDTRFEPSPVPDQTGRENYVDNDRLAMGAGFEAELNVLGMKLYGGVHLQAQALLPRSVRKDLSGSHPVIDEFPDDARNIFTNSPISDAEGLQTNNPGYPGFSSGGFLFGAGVTLRTPL